ncbi:MAG: amino acid ABC transporter permease [Kurthia sp.]|nr:amino acid ABC transporter permease [Candidatus Kurthia equi]
MSFDYFMSVLKPMLTGAQMTLLLFFITIILSIPFGFVVMLAQKSAFKPLSWLAHAFVYVMRGTPLLLQLIVVCYGLPVLPYIGEHLVLDRFTAASIAFVLNYSAYFAEIFRGGVLAIDKGQYEAAQVLGLNKFQTLTKIVIPQMFRIALPSLANESITLMKDTALIYAVAVPELLHYAQTAVNRDLNFFPFVLAGIIYLLLTAVLTFIFKFFERKYSFE